MFIWKKEKKSEKLLTNLKKKHNFISNKFI